MNNVSVNHTDEVAERAELNCSADAADQQCSPIIAGLAAVVTFCDIYLTPVIICVGVIGNILSFMVFSSTYLRRLSSSVYLAALAITDVCFLVNLFVTWLAHFGVSLWSLHGWCHYLVYAAYVTSFLSVWYVVCFTIERCLVVCLPLQRQVFCRPSRAKIVVAVFAVGALAAYSWSILTVHIELTKDGPQCYPVIDYLPLATAISNVDTVVTLVIPALVIVLSNLRIAYALSRFYRTRRAIDLTVRRRAAQQGVSGAQRSSSGSSSSAGAQPAVSNVDAAALTVCHATTSRRVCSAAATPNTSYNRLQMKVTKMLLVVSTAFLIYNIPSHAIRVYVIVAPHTYLLHVVQKLSLVVYNAGFASNFILYSISGRTFRKAFLRMWRCFAQRAATCLYAKYAAARSRSESQPRPEVHFRLKRRANAYN